MRYSKALIARMMMDLPDFRPPSQSFIVVRPPPSKTNHPLNLQVQFVSPPPMSREPARTSGDYSASVDPVPPPSASSSSWDVLTSGHASATSLSSSASVLSPTFKRSITPLYNLQAHNILTNVIADAETDAKVAKFHKQNMEMLGLAILEPVEIWEGRLPNTQSDRAFSVESEATSSATSFSSNVQSSQDTHHDTVGSSTGASASNRTLLSSKSTDQTSSSGGVRNFFGKVFGKKGSGSTSSARKRVSPPSQDPQQDPQLESAQQFAFSTKRTLGVLPFLECPVIPPQGKYPGAYTWTIRRWLKYEDIGRIPTEVQFEWRRAKKKEKTRAEGLRRKTMEYERAKERTTSSAPPPFRQHIPQSQSQPHVSPRRRSFDMEDPDEESDTEDSDTPWVCTIICSRLDTNPSDSSSQPAASNQQPQALRVRVGSVIPAPHHPKVAAMVKIPDPLPDINLRKCTAQKRSQNTTKRPATGTSTSDRPLNTQSSQSNFPMHSRSALESLLSSIHDLSMPLVLTSREIKDIVVCTGIWLIVREGFGGVGLEKRRGDGWKIRG